MEVFLYIIVIVVLFRMCIPSYKRPSASSFVHTSTPTKQQSSEEFWAYVEKATGIKESDLELVEKIAPKPISTWKSTDTFVSTPAIKYPNWFICDWGIGTPSPAEQLIINELDKYVVHWEREVSFEGLQLPSKGWCRFDFYLPDHHMVIEYHGKLWHSSPERVAADKLKMKFCLDNNIKYVWYDSKDYYRMSSRISDLMKELDIPAY